MIEALQETPVKRSLNPFSLLKNKYLIVGTLFILYLIFVDKNNLVTQVELTKTQAKLEGDKEYYKQMIGEAKAAKLDLEKNKEKIAREKFLMHREDEEVFIIAFK